MDKITIYDNAFCKVEFVEAHDLMIESWQEQCQDMLANELLSQAKEIAMLSYLHKPQYSILDMRFLPVIDPASQAWLDENLKPIYIENGLKKSAIVIKGEEALLEALSAEQMMSEGDTANNIEHRFFSNITEAQAWILGVVH